MPRSSALGDGFVVPTSAIHSPPGRANLHSKEQTQGPTFDFVLPEENVSGIEIYSCISPELVCLMIKQWMIEDYSRPELRHEIERQESLEESERPMLGHLRRAKLMRPELLSIEHQELFKLADKKSGHVLILTDGAYIQNTRTKTVTILAVLVPHDPRVRWYYTRLSAETLYKRLRPDSGRHLITPKHYLLPPSASHKRFFVYLRESFLSAVPFPDHPDFIAAQKITDFCPEILNPDTATRRLESSNQINTYAIKNPSRSPASGRRAAAGPHDGPESVAPSDDRYLLAISAPERLVAGHMNLRCAEYLLLKRRFFQAFHKGVIRAPRAIIEAAAEAFEQRQQEASSAPDDEQHDIMDVEPSDNVPSPPSLSARDLSGLAPPAPPPAPPTGPPQRQPHPLANSEMATAVSAADRKGDDATNEALGDQWRDGDEQRVTRSMARGAGRRPRAKESTPTSTSTIPTIPTIVITTATANSTPTPSPAPTPTPSSPRPTATTTTTTTLAPPPPQRRSRGGTPTTPTTVHLNRQLQRRAEDSTAPALATAPARPPAPATAPAAVATPGTSRRRNAVRTDRLHAEWLERNSGLNSSRIRLLVAAWRELGFLEEGRWVEWVRGEEGEEEGDDEEEED